MSINKIHFTSLYSVDYDSDLLHQWLQHYLKFGFDTYHIFFHTNHDNMGEGFRQSYVDEIRRIYNDRVTAEFIEGNPVFRCGNLRVQTLQNYIKKLPLYDSVVVADSDEFHDMDAIGYRRIIESHDCVCGTLIDRWGDTLESARMDTNVFRQYPHEGNFYKSIGHRFASNEACTFGRFKIMAHRVHVPVNLLGSHLLDGATSAKIPEHYSTLSGFRVLHFTFRSTFVKRMLERVYYSGEDIYQVMKAFHMEDSHWLEVLRVREQKRQEEMGWVPANG